MTQANRICSSTPWVEGPVGAVAHDLSPVTVLRCGVTTASDVWLNWQLLGNYLSDLERYDDAEAAYQRWRVPCAPTTP